MVRTGVSGSMVVNGSAVAALAQRGVRLALACWCAAGAMAVHSAPEDLESVYLDGFVDRRASETKVGGRPLVGTVALGEPATGVMRPALVFPKALLQAPVAHCLETVSVDGSYWSQGQVPADVLRRGATRMRVRYGDPRQPQEEREIDRILDGLGAANVAVLATVGACQDEAPARKVVVAYRQATPLPPLSGVRLFVNSSKNKVEVLYTDAAGAARSAACRAIAGERQRIAFDTLCDLEGPLAESTTLRMTLIRFERRMPAIEYTLLASQVGAGR